MSYAQPTASWHEVDPLEKQRQRLLAMLAKQGAGHPLFGGLGRGTHSLVDHPESALPQITFNPFAAQHSRGVPGLMGPTHGGGPVSDATGAPLGAPAGPAQGFQGQDQGEAHGGPGGGPPPGYEQTGQQAATAGAGRFEVPMVHTPPQLAAAAQPQQSFSLPQQTSLRPPPPTPDMFYQTALRLLRGE